MEMSTTESKQVIVDIWTEALGGNIDALDELFHEDARYVDPGADIHGLDEIKSYIQEWADAFPDFTFNVEESVAEDDVVVTYFSGSGTHDGEFQGIAPTGNTFEGEGVQIDRFEGDKVVEEINLWDNMTLFEQLGIDPAEL